MYISVFFRVMVVGLSITAQLSLFGMEKEQHKAVVRFSNPQVMLVDGSDTTVHFGDRSEKAYTVDVSFNSKYSNIVKGMALPDMFLESEIRKDRFDLYIPKNGELIRVKYLNADNEVTVFTEIQGICDIGQLSNINHYFNVSSM